jgi:SnoaL-like domain
MDALAQLALQQRLIDNYNDYAEGLDTRDWKRVRACFSDRVTIDYGDVGAGGQSLWDADAWLAHLRGVLEGFDGTHHAITNHRFSLADDAVNCRAYLVAEHVILPDPAVPEVGAADVCTVVGEYSNTYEEQPDGRWTICHSRLSVKWSAGNPALFITAAERYAARLATHTDTGA